MKRPLPSGSAVDIGGIAHGLGQEILARDAGHRGQNIGLVDAARAQLAVDHGAARRPCGSGADTAAKAVV
jgi:hypothetical protein